MNLSTWKSLTSEDQTAWDAVTDDGKIKIFNYASVRSNRKEKGDGSYSRSADSHDIQDNGPNLEVGTHITEDTPDILATATHTDTKRLVSNPRLTFVNYLPRPIISTLKMSHLNAHPSLLKHVLMNAFPTKNSILPYLVMKMNVNMNDASHLIFEQASTPP